MIKIDNAEVVGFEHAIRGMRNPMNSWDKSDSGLCNENYCDKGCPYSNTNCSNISYEDFIIGSNDLSLMKKLSKAGTDHRKFMRMLVVYVDITAPLYWWKEFDTYKVGTVANSCSTMHKIHAKEFTLDDFSTEHLTDGTKRIIQETIFELNAWRDRYLDYDKLAESTKNELNSKNPQYKKDIWWQMIQLLPSSYNQKRTIMLNYEVLSNIYNSRINHKLDEWCTLCKWIEDLPCSILITGGDSE